MGEQTFELHGYSIKNTQFFPTRNGLGFHAALIFNGDCIGTVTNNGDAGASSATFTQCEERNAFERIVATYVDTLMPTLHLSLKIDMFIDHLMDISTFGKVLSMEEVQTMLTV